MDVLASFFRAFSSRRSYESLNFTEISPLVQDHLKQVAAMVGAYLQLLWNMGGMLTVLGWMGSNAWLLMTPVCEERKRVGLLVASSFFQGASLGPLIEYAIEFDLSILVTAFVGIVVAFGCFSAAATLARRREYIYLGGFLSAGFSIVFSLHFASTFIGGSAAFFKLELCLGLLLVVLGGYMVVDARVIIDERSRSAAKFAAVFVQFLTHMTKGAAESLRMRRGQIRNEKGTDNEII